MTDLTAPTPSPPSALESPSSRWRRLVAWSSTSAPVTLLLIVGFACGPRGVNLLTTDALSFFDPAMPVAIASLGVLAGLALGNRRSDTGRLFTGAWLEFAITLLIVAGGLGAAALLGMSFVGESTLPLIMILGISAASSVTLHTGDSLEPRSVVVRLAELEVVWPIVAGGLLLAALRTHTVPGTVVLTAESCAVTGALAGTAWFLLTRATTDTEQRVLVVSALLLVGGVSGALALSSLLGGLIAGMFWAYAGKQPRETVRRHATFVQHPLLVLVLLVAGARTVLSPASLMLGGSYVILRVLGRVAGGAAASHGLGLTGPSRLDLSLLSPGVFGVAFALDTAITDARGLPLSAVVVGTVLSELVATLVAPTKAGE